MSNQKKSMAENTKEQQTNKWIKSSLKGNRQSQKMLYKHFYGYGMTICMRYAKNREEAQEILNDGFIKVFKKLDSFQFDKPFKFWLRRILINTAIDYLRKYKKYHQTEDLATVYDASVEADGLSNMSAQEILKLVQKLAPSYRTVFNLFVIDGYSHKEIAEELGISVGTSKSNLGMAKKRLRVMYSALHASI